MSDALAPGQAIDAASGAAAAAPVPPPPVERFRFSGSGAEYFGIWIVNLLLTLVTIGLYSPWAKVRRKRYFYGNTWLADSNFEYHGNAIAILKGRLIAFAAFVAYSVVTHYWPRMGAVVLLALMPAVPWLMVRSFSFNAVNSSYRNLRFHFDGTYREALAAVWPFALVPIATLLLPRLDPAHPPKRLADMWFALVPALVALLVYPYLVARVKRLHVDRSRFGRTPLHCTATVGSFYGAYVVAALLALLAAGAMGAFAGMLMFAFGRGGAGPWVLIGAMAFIYVAVGALMLAYTRSRVGNLVFNATTLEGGWRFRSVLGAMRLWGMYATNFVAIMATLGLLMPWAAVRVARYRAECLSLEGGASLDAFVADASRAVAATGEELGEMFDVDLSL